MKSVLSFIRSFLGNASEGNQNPEDWCVRSSSFYCWMSDYPCWKCQKKTKMYAIVVDSGHKQWLEIDNEEISAWITVKSPIILKFVTRISEVAEKKIFQITGGSYRKNYSKAFDGTYLMNHCKHCGTKQGDNALHLPGGAFWPQTVESSEKLIFLKANDPLFANGECWYFDALEYFLRKV